MLSITMHLSSIYFLLFTGDTLGKLIVNIEDVDFLEVERIQKEGALIETIMRKTSCEGVRVRLF